MEEASIPEGPPTDSAIPRSRRRPRVVILLAFLGAFLLLLIVFRSVLFPFLLAIFIAYLIEPIVAAFTKAPVFGIRWTRGPTIVLMYVVLLGGIVLAASCTVATVTTSVKQFSGEIATALDETAERARFQVAAPATATDETPDPIDAPEANGSEEGAEPAPPVLDEGPSFARDVVVPSGTLVVLRRHRAPDRTRQPPLEVFATWYEAVLPAGATEISVLLRDTRQEVPAGANVGSVLNPENIRFGDGEPVPLERLTVDLGETATGLELFIERNLVTPIVENLEKAGYHVEPIEAREVIAAQAKALGEDLPERVTRFTRDFIASLALSIYEFILILMLTAFIVMDRRAISRFFASLPPERHRDEYLTLIRYIDRGLAGVIRGQLVICLVNGILTYIGLKIFAVKAAEVLALIAGVLSLIPIFGTIVSSIPIVLLAATDGIDKGLFALGWIMFIHLLEGNLLNPLIMGSHARMHPVIIIFALLAGEHSFGVWGALLAVPTASIIQSCFLFYRHEIEGIPWEAPPKAHGEWMRKILGAPFRRRPAET
jgi:predicted PurR-regulated permease PerM